jgi:hypothetical protein
MSCSSAALSRTRRSPGVRLEVSAHRAAKLGHATGLVAERGIKRLDSVEAKLHRAQEVLFERMVDVGELLVLRRDELHLLFKRAVQLDELRVHGLRGGLQVVVLADELEALDGVLDGGQQFLAQPGLDDEAVDFALVDGVDHGVQAQHGGDEDARGVGLDLARLGQQLEAGERGHALIGDDDGELGLLELGQRAAGVRHGDDLVAFAPEGFVERHQDDFFVVHHQDAVGFGIRRFDRFFHE